MNTKYLADRGDSQLVLIDVQERLCGAMTEPVLATTLRNGSILLQAARLLDVPVLYTEQYPKGLGSTLPVLTQWLDPGRRVEKTCFSCCKVPAFRELLDSRRGQIMLAGMEAHICILQTALQLHEMGHQVFVIEDAVISRNPSHHENAMARLRQHGVTVTNTESLLFEWLEAAEGDAFREIARLIK